MKEHNIEYVEWLDSCGANGWHDPHDECEAAVCVSVGWISDESDSAITLTSHMQIKYREHHADIIIPKCSITKRVVIQPCTTNKYYKDSTVEPMIGDIVIIPTGGEGEVGYINIGLINAIGNNTFDGSTVINDPSKFTFVRRGQEA